MKNLKNNLTLSSSEFLRLIISSKRNTSTDCNRKTRLLSLETKIAPPYSDYDTRFTTNDLISLINLNVSDVEKSDLLSLYSYKNTKLTNFRKKISTDTSNIYQATCQYCTINSVNSLDHFVPKNSFPEFSV
ncbi:HNH endonuclease, partial [Acinetobacter sp. ABJ_C3_5]